LAGAAFNKTADSGEIVQTGEPWERFAVQTGAQLVADAATRSLIDGSDFGDNVLAALPDAIAQTVGNVFSAAVNGAFEDVKAQKEADAADAMKAPSGSEEQGEADVRLSEAITALIKGANDLQDVDDVIVGFKFLSPEDQQVLSDRFGPLARMDAGDVD